MSTLDLTLSSSPVEITFAPGYRIWPEGRVQSCRGTGGAKGTFGQWQDMVPQRDKHGYLCVRMVIEGRKRRHFIHTLVLTHFRGPKPRGLVCRHCDGNNQNNRIENLCWGTQAENLRDRARHGTDNKGSRHGMSKLSDEEAGAIYALKNTGISGYEVARRFHVVNQTVYSIWNGQRWGHVTGATQGAV